MGLEVRWVVIHDVDFKYQPRSTLPPRRRRCHLTTSSRLLGFKGASPFGSRLARQAGIRPTAAARPKRLSVARRPAASWHSMPTAAARPKRTASVARACPAGWQSMPTAAARSAGWARFPSRRPAPARARGGRGRRRARAQPARPARVGVAGAERGVVRGDELVREAQGRAAVVVVRGPRAVQYEPCASPSSSSPYAARVRVRARGRAVVVRARRRPDDDDDDDARPRALSRSHASARAAARPAEGGREHPVEVVPHRAAPRLLLALLDRLLQRLDVVGDGLRALVRAVGRRARSQRRHHGRPSYASTVSRVASGSGAWAAGARDGRCGSTMEVAASVPYERTTAPGLPK